MRRGVGIRLHQHGAGIAEHNDSKGKEMTQANMKPVAMKRLFCAEETVRKARCDSGPTGNDG